MTFLSKLDVQRTSYKLTVCIDDGSAVAVANISSHVSYCHAKSHHSSMHFAYFDINYGS